MKVSDRHHPGFTLVEMMVSLALGCVILLLAAAVLGSTGDGYGRSSGGVATAREGRALFDRLGADLASAVMVDGARLDSESGDDVAFLTLLPAAAQADDGWIGDACAVSYRLVDIEAGGRTRRCLVRSLRESGETLAALRDGKSATLFTGSFPIEEPLAFDVVAFEARPKTGDGKDWKVSSGSPPDRLEITLVLARPELAGRTRAAADWNRLAEDLSLAGLENLTTTLRFGNHARP